MRREFFILANVNETQQRYAKWNERTPEGKRRKQMAQVNLEIVSSDHILNQPTVCAGTVMMPSLRAISPPKR